ncbi:ABC transporter permease [Candidatus Hecatella orcuttiae]|jgi:molybdate transport system permease protein|uniref:ABC transporter permease n=1 Tax=Candidatus Hecatella orcuttiae TaxID=1935119 RepID=UPI002867B934|nr:ABC transporter permease subunit [Candidatus Hecatella orcuttiae]
MDLGREKVFKLTTGSFLFAFFIFLLLIIASLALYTDPQALFSALFSGEVLFSIRLSMVTATAATAACLTVALPAAYTLSRTEFFGKNFVDVILNIPIVTPPVALGAALLIFMNTPLGVGVRDVFVFQVAGIVLAQFTVITALAIRLMKATFDNIDPRYENVARTLGYNKFQAFFKVTLPIARGGIIAAAILAWTRAMGEFGATVMLAGATRMKTETLPIAIYLSLATASVEKAAAVIFILIGLAVVTLLAFQKISGRGVVL